MRPWLLLALAACCLSTSLQAQYELFPGKKGFVGLKQGKKTLLKPKFRSLEPIEQDGFPQGLVFACENVHKKGPTNVLEPISFFAPVGWMHSVEDSSCQCGLWSLETQKWLLPPRYRMLILKQIDKQALAFAAAQADMPLEQGEVWRIENAKQAQKILSAPVLDPGNQASFFEVRDSHAFSSLYRFDAQGQLQKLALPPSDRMAILSPELIWSEQNEVGQLYTPEGRALLAEPGRELQPIPGMEGQLLALLAQGSSGLQVYVPSRKENFNFKGYLKYSPLSGHANPYFRHFLLEGPAGHALLTLEQKKNGPVKVLVLALPNLKEGESGNEVLVPQSASKNAHFAFAFQLKNEAWCYYFPEQGSVFRFVKKAQSLVAYNYEPALNKLFLSYEIDENNYLSFCVKEDVLVLDDVKFKEPLSYNAYVVEKDGKFGVWNVLDNSWILPLFYTNYSNNIRNHWDEALELDNSTESKIFYFQAPDGLWLAWDSQTQMPPQPLPKLESTLPLLWKQRVGMTSYRSNFWVHKQQIWLPSKGLQRDSVALDSLDGMFCLDGKTGKILQQFKPKTPGDHDANALAQANDCLFWGSDQGIAYCLDLKTKRLRWQQNLGASLESKPALADFNGDGQVDVVFTCRKPAHVKALDGKTGKLLWVSFIGDEIMAAPLVGDFNGDGQADVMACNTASAASKCHAFDGKTGKELWHISVHSGVQASPQALMWEGEPHVLITPSDDALMLCKNDGSFVQYLQSGYGILATPFLWTDSLWIVGMRHPKEQTGALGLHHLFQKIVTNGGGNLVSKGLVSQQTAGKILASPFLAELNDKGLLAWLATESGVLYGVNKQGFVVSTYQLPTGLEATPLLADVNGDGKLELLLAGLDGYLYCFATKQTKLPKQGFPYAQP